MGIWWPIFAFVSLGFDHVVANMTFIPLAIWVDAPHITVGLYIWKGIIPTLLGNILGGGLFCGKSRSLEVSWIQSLTRIPGTYYWYMYLMDMNTITIPGLGKNVSGQSSREQLPTKNDDVEASAGVTNERSA